MIIFAAFMCMATGSGTHCNQLDPGRMTFGGYAPGAVYRSAAECRRSLPRHIPSDIRFICLSRHIDTWN